MLIDDEDNLRQAIEQLLTSNGYAFCGAKDAESGMEMLLHEKPDLLLTRRDAAGKNGFDLCARIREEGRRIPVISFLRNAILSTRASASVGWGRLCDQAVRCHGVAAAHRANIRRHKDTIDFARSRNREGVAQIGDLEVHFGEYQVRIKGKRCN